MARKIRNQCDKKTKTAQQIRRKRVTKIVYLRSINIGITQGKDKKKFWKRGTCRQKRNNCQWQMTPWTEKATDKIRGTS